MCKTEKTVRLPKLTRSGKPGSAIFSDCSKNGELMHLYLWRADITSSWAINVFCGARLNRLLAPYKIP